MTACRGCGGMVKVAGVIARTSYLELELETRRRGLVLFHAVVVFHVVVFLHFVFLRLVFLGLFGLRVLFHVIFFHLIVLHLVLFHVVVLHVVLLHGVARLRKSRKRQGQKRHGHQPANHLVHANFLLCRFELTPRNPGRIYETWSGIKSYTCLYKKGERTSGSVGTVLMWGLY